jgi:hypothetical protein
MLPEVVYGDLLSPMFYGTGEMLTWDTAALLNATDRREIGRAHV